MVLTVMKAPGPGWLILAELVEDGRYKAVLERYGSVPLPEEVMNFVHRLPRLLDAVAGVAAEEQRERRRISPKRAARAAAREVREQRDLATPTRSMQIKSEEVGLADVLRPEAQVLEVEVWVRPGRAHAVWTGQTHSGLPVVDVPGSLSDHRTNDQVIGTLARHYATRPQAIALLEGFTAQRKRFQITGVKGRAQPCGPSTPPASEDPPAHSATQRSAAGGSSSSTSSSGYSG